MREALKVTAIAAPNVSYGLPVKVDVEWLGKVMTSDNQGIVQSRGDGRREVKVIL